MKPSPVLGGLLAVGFLSWFKRTGEPSIGQSAHGTAIIPPAPRNWWVGGAIAVAAWLALTGGVGKGRSPLLVYTVPL